MDIDIDPTDAALVVDLLIQARRIQTGMAEMAYASEAERQLARLKVQAADHHIAAIRNRLGVKP